jgi:acetate kinase
MAILAVNAGSSSLKFAVYPVRHGRVLDCVLSGNVQGLEPGGRPELGWRFQGQSHRQALLAPGAVPGADPFQAALQSLRQLLLTQPGIPRLQAVAHRVVHGGQRFRASVRVDANILQQLSALNSLAPLHQPHNVEGIRAFLAAFPDLPQIACFDTAFHATMAEVDYAFALPQDLSAQGIRRYGFHGLSYQFVMGTLLKQTARAQGRVLMAHLGNGASLCAATQGLSRATTMGFSALDGLMMGTRSGALDAGVLLYLLEQGWDHQRLQTLLYQQSGLLGVSGISADMRRLRADGSPAAHKAIALFSRRVVRESGALAACLGGLDVLAFSGGIGEHDVVLRQEVCAALAHLGVQLEPSRNTQATGEVAMAIHASQSAVEVWVVPTDEGRVAAAEAARLISCP